jgi:hypothetical protein
MEPTAKTLTVETAKRRIREMLEADGLPQYPMAVSGPQAGWLQASILEERARVSAVLSVLDEVIEEYC